MLEEIQRPSLSNNVKRKSIMLIQGNPLETGEKTPGLDLKIENISDCTAITAEQLKNILEKLKSAASNEARIAILIEEKQPYLFSSDDLAQLIEVTPSIRTKLSIFSSIGPRLIDPHARLAYFTGLFRFSEEKAIVEEILRDRAQTLSASLFAKIEPNSPSFRAIAGRGLYAGRGGRRGRGERDAIRRASTFEATTDSTPIEVKEQKGSNRWSMPSYATGTDNRGII